MRPVEFVSVLMILCVVLVPSVIIAQAQPPEEAIAEPVIGTADLEAFLDGVIEARMASFHVPGVTISVVHGGEMVFAKGYGYGDVENRRPVDPAITLFRPGSISKTFTWTAVM
jgi:CubicO group peptidase (beta-lactamase class C family)